MSAPNKLSKDQIQKLALGAIGFIAIVYVYFSFFLGPLTKSRATMEATIADLQEKVGSSQTTLQRTAKLERDAGSATERFARLDQLSPAGSPLAWFPPRIKAFFADHQIDRAVARLGGSAPPKDAELENWETHTWLIDLPQVEYHTLGKAIAALENAEPLLAIVKLNFSVVAQDPQFQHVDLIAQHVIEKK